VHVTRGPFDRLATTAGLVFLTDFATKQWALATLGATRIALGSGWHLVVVNNTHLAGGVDTGGFDLPLTAVLTAIVVLLVLGVCRQLSVVDASAPTVLGLFVGAGAGNLADALIPPHGVVDFIAFTTETGRTTSFNVADVALLAALVLSIRTVWRLVLAIRGRVRSATRPRRPSGALVMRDRIFVSAGHALMAMCAFIWIYSMAIALTPDAGRSAPNALLSGVGVFGIVFIVSQAWQRMTTRDLLATRRPVPLERVILDSSLPNAALTDLPARGPVTPRPEIHPADDRQREHGDGA
jgi:lipoprotein signal peptidase